MPYGWIHRWRIRALGLPQAFLPFFSAPLRLSQNAIT
jgi:hypothetical protein